MKSVILTILIVLVSVSFGCALHKSQPANSPGAFQPFNRPSPTNKGITNPGDPRLTYEIVSANLDAYQGRRVTWFGSLWGSETVWATNGKTNPTYYVLAANHGEVPETNNLRFFSFEGREKMFPKEWYGWITGNLKGTHKPAKNTYEAIPNGAELPLLTDVEVEEYIRPTKP